MWPAALERARAAPVGEGQAEPTGTPAPHGRRSPRAPRAPGLSLVGSRSLGSGGAWGPEPRKGPTHAL